MQCEKCGFKSPEGNKFCGECGTRLKIICPECKFSNPASFKFCGSAARMVGWRNTRKNWPGFHRKGVKSAFDS